MRWQWFSHSLSIPHLRDYLQRLDDFEDVEAEVRALQVAEQHPGSLLGLQFLLGWGGQYDSLRRRRAPQCPTHAGGQPVAAAAGVLHTGDGAHQALPLRR